YPALDVVRPALAIGGLAMLVLIYEKIVARESFDFAAPDGFLLGGFVVAAGLSVFGAVWPSYALDAAINVLKMAVVYVLIVNTVATQARLKTLLWTMVLLGLFPALGSLWYWQNDMRVEGRAAWFGSFANPNEMAYSLVILIPLAVELGRKANLIQRLLLA